VATTLDLDEDLSIQEGGWRGRAITFGVLLLIGAFVSAGIYYFFIRDESQTTTRSTEDIAAKKATINSTLVISGTADAALNSDLTFQSSGKVAQVLVKIGDVAKQGQVLASLESQDLANAVASAQANQRAVQLKLDDLLDGSSDAEIAAAEQGVAQAESALTKAQNDYDDLLDGPSAVEVATAEQAVSLAESQLAAATSTLEKLENTPSDADVAAAEAGVAAATSALTAAQNSAANAHNTVSSAAASLLSAETSYCGADATPAFCTTPATPIGSADLATLNAALGGADAALASAAIDLVEQGPSAEEMDAAEASVASAEAALDAAEARLADVQDGADDAAISSQAATLESAKAGLASARAKLAEARRGPDQNAIEQARQAVRTAQLAVEGAQIRLRNAQIIAPFDGTIAAVNIAPGEFASAASQTPPIVMLTPDALLLKISVGETDYPDVKLDQGGVALFDGMPGKIYPFRITQIGLSPTVTQGVVTFDVKASLTVLPDSPRPAPGMNARGQLTIGSKADVLVVPPRAIRRRGSEIIVDVRRNGAIEEQAVTTGISDTENIEILTGLVEGDLVVVPVVNASAPGGGGPTPVPMIPGGIR
jgi:HlyD family secretion protein